MIAFAPIALDSVMSQAVLSLDAIRARLLSDLALAVTVVGVAWMQVPGHQGLGLAFGNAIAYVITCAVLAVPLRRLLHGLIRMGSKGAV